MRIWRKALAALAAFALLVPAAEANEEPIRRIAGTDRYETAALLATEAVSSADTVLVASGETPYDALSAGPLSVHEKAPVVLTAKDALPNASKEAIRSLNPDRILILGGEKTVSEAVQKELESMAETVRLAGADRKETSRIIASYIAEQFPTATKIGLASDTVFADALTAGPFMGRNGALLLTDGREEVPADVIFGGEKWIPGFAGVKRLAGKDRYETSVRIAEEMLSQTLIVASGEDFPDALAAVNLAGAYRAPIVLTQSDALPESVKELLQQNNIERILVVGGDRTVAPIVLEALKQAQTPAPQPEVPVPPKPETPVTPNPGETETPTEPDLQETVHFEARELQKEVARLLVDSDNLWDPSKAITREEAKTYEPTREDLRNLKRIHLLGPYLDEDYNDIEPEDIVGLEEAINAEYVYLSRFRIDDFSPLLKMTKLKSLTLNRCDVDNLDVIQQLGTLEVLNLEMNRIRSLNGLEKLANLRRLNLTGNPIDSAEPLRTLTNLERLELQNTGLKEVEPLAALTKLTYLDLSGNEIRSIEELGAKPELDFLNLTGKDLRHGDPNPEKKGNILSDIQVLAGMPKLRVLFLQDTKEISDLTPLAGLTNLEALTVRNNKITDIEPLKNLKKMQYLHIYENQVVDLAPLAGLTELVELNFSKNRVEDISPLQDLDRLIVLFAYDNRIVDPAPLEALQNVRVANLSINRIHDLSGLQDQTAPDRMEQYVMDSQTVTATKTEVKERTVDAGKTTLYVNNPVKGIDGNHVAFSMEPAERSEWDDILNQKIDAFNNALEALKEKGIVVQSQGDDHSVLSIAVPTESISTLGEITLPFLQTDGIQALYYETDFPEIVSSIVSNTFEYPVLKEGEGWEMSFPYSGTWTIPLD